MVYVLKPDGSNEGVRSDSNGVVRITGEAGTYRVAAYKENYKPCALDLEIKVNDKKQTLLGLTPGKLIVGSLTVKRMTLDEIKAVGIDVTAPQNQFVYKYNVELRFENETAEVEHYVNGFGQIYNWKPFKIKDLVVYPVPVKVSSEAYESTKEKKPIITYMTIPGGASWLKEFFEVKLVVQNTADPEFVIADSQASLELPEGLTFIPSDKSSSINVNLGNVVGGQSKSTSWVIRGDEKGEYTVKAQFDGTLMPFNEKVTTIFTSDKFKVWGSDALKLTIEADDYAYEDIPYNISTRLTNVSDIDVYNVNLQLNEDPNYYYVLCDKEQSVPKLTPGQSIDLEHQLWSMFDGPLENIETIFTNKQDPNNALKVEVIKRKAPLHVSTAVRMDSIDDDSTNYITVEALIDNKKPYVAENIIAELGWDSAGIELISGPVIQQIASLDSKSSTKVIWKLKASYREYGEYVFTVKVKAANAREIESKTSYKTYKKVIYESSGNDYSSDDEDDEDYYDTFDDSYYDNMDDEGRFDWLQKTLEWTLKSAIFVTNPPLAVSYITNKPTQMFIDGLAKGLINGFFGTLKSEVTDVIDLVKLSVNASIAIQKAKLKAKVFVMLYLTNPEFKEYVDDSLQEMASKVEVLWNNREVVFKAVKEKVIEGADYLAKAARENLIQTFEAASGLQRDEDGFVEFSVGYSIGNVAGFVAETALIALATAGVGFAAKAGKLGKISKLVDMILDAAKMVDPSELLNLLNPKKVKKILFEGIDQTLIKRLDDLGIDPSKYDGLGIVGRESAESVADAVRMLKNGLDDFYKALEDGKIVIKDLSGNPYKSNKIAAAIDMAADSKNINIGFNGASKYNPSIDVNFSASIPEDVASTLNKKARADFINKIYTNNSLDTLYQNRFIDDLFT